ncbi:alanine--glyoxylate aminotransferase-like [Cydia splendana]|uniref:alanine--glyoxylate aminotransferase-like n=1 Tax=Cydia splendana TaxID=1100963 RepID=UPI00300D122C
MASHRLGVPAPIISDRQFSKPLMCGPGPNDLYPAVAAAYAAPVISPACAEYYKVIEDIRAGIQYAFQTRSNLVLAVSGSGHAGMETVICNLLAPGELLLVPSRGLWDERAKDMARRYGIRVETIKTSEPFTTFSLEELESALERHRPAGLFITHGDSSTGTLQTLKGLGDLCHKYDTLLLVDIVASLGAEPVLMDEWGVDGAYASCQKALSGPAGVAPVAFSARADAYYASWQKALSGPAGVAPVAFSARAERSYSGCRRRVCVVPEGAEQAGRAFSARAEAKIFSRSHDVPFYFDITFLARQWKCYDDTFFYHHTLSSPLLFALRACLSQLAQESLPRAWARHAAVTAHFHARLRAHGFRFLVRRPEDRMNAITTVLPGMECNTFVAELRSKAWSTEVTKDRGEWKRKTCCADPHNAGGAGRRREKDSTGFILIIIHGYRHNIMITPGLGPTAGVAVRVGLMGANASAAVADRVADAMADVAGLRNATE